MELGAGVVVVVVVVVVGRNCFENGVGNGVRRVSHFYCIGR